jgi:hypothetical protein
MRNGRPTWTVAEVAQHSGRDEQAARWYLDAYRKLGMAGGVDGLWWLRAPVRRALTAAAPSEPCVADAAWIDVGWVRWSKETGWEREW